MTQCGITPSELETLAMDRAGWRFTCKSAVEEFEVRRIQELEAKWGLRKFGPPSSSNFECQICHRMCRSRIGLLAHNKSHSWWWDPSYRRLSPWFNNAEDVMEFCEICYFCKNATCLTVSHLSWSTRPDQFSHKKAHTKAIHWAHFCSACPFIPIWNSWSPS